MFSCQVLVVLFILTSVITYGGGQIREGFKCFHRATGKPGKCTLMKDCPAALAQEPTGFKQVQKCGFSGEYALVCCMPSFTPPEPRDEGSSCTLKFSGTEGICRPFDACPKSVEAASRAVLPQLCESNGVIPIGEEPKLVCCDESISPPRPGFNSDNYCRLLKTRDEWKKASQRSCASRSGSMKTSEEAPHLAMLGEKDGTGFLWRSVMASLLSDRWLLGSAWSFARWPLLKFVGLGGKYKPIYSPDLVLTISRQIRHADFNGSLTWVYNDIVLLQLERPVVFTAGILPVCLYTRSLLPESQFRRLTLINTALNNKNEMEEVPWETCFTEYAGNRFFPYGVRNTTQLCARPRPITGVSLECEDYMYGASLYWQGGDWRGEEGCSRLLLGSFADVNSDQSCTRVFTRTTAFLPWIESVVWP